MKIYKYEYIENLIEYLINLKEIVYIFNRL